MGANDSHSHTLWTEDEAAQARRAMIPTNLAHRHWPCLPWQWLHLRGETPFRKWSLAASGDLGARPVQRRARQRSAQLVKGEILLLHTEASATGAQLVSPQDPRPNQLQLVSPQGRRQLSCPYEVYGFRQTQ